jgi:outer membrane protein assembly factor BamB
MTTTTQTVPTRPARPWLGVACAAVLWLLFLIGWALDIQSFAWFLGTMAAYLVIMLLFIGWWLTRRAFTWTERLIGLAGTIGIAVLVGRLSMHTIRPIVFMVTLGMPAVLAVWGAWAFVMAPRRSRFRLGGLIACLAIAWGAFLFIRINGTQGNMRADVHWRWTPTAEEIFLAGRSTPAPASTQPSGRSVTLRPGDWPGFRGPNRDGIVRGLRVALDWQASPPKVLWRQRVGPAWSSMAVVDDHVYTQEQRGEREAVVCRDALTGSEIWAHEEPGRFYEGMSGPGPRATPSFAEGRIYTFGARGTLDCLDAGTGRLLWSRDVGADAGAVVPVFCYSSSPLIAAGRVFVFAGGEGKKGLLAYSIEGGPPVWTADAGKMSYSSPQHFTFGADSNVVIFTNEGLFAINEASGKITWQLPLERAVGVPVAIQPCQVSNNSLILGHGGGFGAMALHVAPEGHSASRQWITRQLKPSFNDMVFHDGLVYGFDGTVFCCVDASTGKRLWRDGRYGAGQVLLLAEQGAMIITSEDGQAVLLRCNSERLEELGRLAAISGKTWNHPAVAQNRLYMRSDAEMACIKLKSLGTH